jgi:hypothetical protein
MKKSTLMKDDERKSSVGDPMGWLVPLIDPFPRLAEGGDISYL